MKLQVATATGAVLDWMVCIAEGLTPEDLYISRITAKVSIYRRFRDEDGKLTGSYTTGPGLLFSSKWEAGGPIIEREGISVILDCGDDWIATKRGVDYDVAYEYPFGPTPLIAAMRCYVASKLGDTVEVPDELCKETS